MRTVHAKSGTRSQHVSNYTRGKRSRKAREYCERKARIVCEHFISLNRLMALVVTVLLKCSIRFSISFRWYGFANFCTQISRPLGRCCHILHPFVASFKGTGEKSGPPPESHQADFCILSALCRFPSQAASRRAGCASSPSFVTSSCSCLTRVATNRRRFLSPPLW